MKVFYISPSTIPSRSANLIHVLFMCEALSKLGHKVTLFLHSDEYTSDECLNIVKESHDIDGNLINIIPYKGNFKKGKELGIALYAILIYLKDLCNRDAPDFIISRNIYGAVMLGILLRRNIIYETHTQETGFRKYFQDFLVVSRKVQTVVISNALKRLILKNNVQHSAKVHVFHDAARANRIRLDLDQRNKFKKILLSSMNTQKNYDKVIGYFGHLYPGRGIEVIQGLAKKHANFAFIVYGGNEKEIENYVKDNESNNLFFMGYIDQSNVHEKMSIMDILLMPYQNQVSIGIDSVDTSKWMSPMKMFEYMSASVPIISSNLPVLREVLIDNENCILVEPSDINAWSEALQRIFSSNYIYEKLSKNSYNDYLNKYTWNIRVKKILKLFS
jgi:glycosyltransferase involved in cell wall biosynthesis